MSSHPERLPDRVVADPDVTHGKPVIEGTRVPVEVGINAPASGESTGEVCGERGLGKEGVIGAELAERLADMAKFRNLLVHRYGEVDDEIVWEIARAGPEDIGEFVTEIQAWVTEG